MARTDSATANENETVETETTDNDGKVSRKRVDLTTLDPNEKVVLSFHVPAGMRLKLRKDAETADKSEAQYVRDMIAGLIGYEIPESFNERRGRVGQYSGLTDEQKKEAIAVDNKAKREQVAKLLTLAASGGIPDEVLAAMGINKDDLPKPRANKE